MTVIPRPRSIRTRCTLAASLLALVALAVVGVTSSLAIRYRVQEAAYNQIEQVAGRWSAAARTGTIPKVIPTSGDLALIQLVDPRGRVLAASHSALTRWALSTLRPPADDRVQRRSDGCRLLVAIRISTAADARVLLAEGREPALLRGHNLEYALTAAALVLLAIVSWTSWRTVGRTLRPVEEIRTRLAEITVSDLSLSIPVPPGDDEVARLVRTANQTLDRLDEAVAQQRRFASTTSHELRNPIAGLRAQLEEALLHPGEIDPHETIRSALSVTDRLDAIVGDLLALARLGAGDPAPPELIDLGRLVSQEAPRAGRVPVRVHAASDVWVRGSHIQLARLLANLVSNAIRHAGSAVDVFVAASDGEVVVTVADDGAGIAPADRERVFERFTRLDDARHRDAGGSGLGLAISRDIARSHGGTLKAEDAPRGASFVLRLPRLDAPPADQTERMRAVACPVPQEVIEPV
ncbi:sensor histidine kinase [Nonomuraea angiospora]|uniref:histidine kinase n=1 Tax=Nonomuraea angiospora TaxID=46172 RepID=A0ABR9LYU2_9ACTN|nr:HAMP domain-containing sensor histidine kinase [Nonomuraea angiospora]MBE1585819.1 signal transduction histidine kinase [Nonomuraea angiospora]